MSIKTQILQPALRAMGEETSFSIAPNDAYVRAFNAYVDMLNMWLDSGLTLYGGIPKSMDDSIGTEDPKQALWQNLVVFAADLFMYSPTPRQAANAEIGMRTIRNRSNGTAYTRKPKNMPRGSGNTWYKNCRDSKSRNLTNEQEINIVSNANE